jgi:amino acid adenylation domain-containing protein
LPRETIANSNYRGNGYQGGACGRSLLGGRFADRQLNSFTAHFERQAEATPAAPAIEFEGRVWSYEDVNRYANRAARYLLDQGYEREARIGICIDRSADCVIAMLAILKAGCAFVPLDPDFPKDRLAFIVADASIQRIFCNSEYQALFDRPDTFFLNLNDKALQDSSSDNLEVQVGDDSLAYVMYTSGSTGKPKGVQIEHRSLVTYCLADIELYRLQASDRTLQFSTLSFDIAIEEIFPPLLAGSTVVVRARGRASTHNELSQLIGELQITALHIATAYWNEWVDLLVASKAFVPESLRLLVATGEKISVQHYRRWKQHCRHEVLWCNAYGPTETTVTCTAFLPQPGWDEPEMPIGKPLRGYAAHILNDHHQTVGDGEIGELFISGPALARGYLNRPELNEKAFLWLDLQGTGALTRVYRTGDLARWLASGDIEFGGRVDQQVKIGSYRIEPGEIESVVLQFSSIREALVVCHESHGQKYLIAYVVCPQGSVTAREIAAFLRDRLPAYMVPARYIFLESLPKTINGKIDRKSLPPADQGEVARENPFEEAASDLERELVRIWQQVLQLPSIGRHDDFFLLGGSSLLVTKVIAQLAGQLQLAIPVRDFFASPTIASLTRHLTALKQREESPDSTIDATQAFEECRAARQRLPNLQVDFVASGHARLAAILYPAVPGLKRNCQHAVVLCNAYGLENARAHRNLQQLAILLAQEGFDVLRFDYACTGNSSGEDRAATLSQWRTDIESVVAYLRDSRRNITQLTPRSISLVGIRLGATLIAQTNLAGIEHAVLWDPIYSGTEYLNLLDGLHRYQLESFTRYLNRRTAMPDQLLGYACPPSLRLQLRAIELHKEVNVRAKEIWFVTSQGGDKLTATIDRPSSWHEVECHDAILWEQSTYVQRAFSSPQAFRTVLSILKGEA